MGSRANTPANGRTVVRTGIHPGTGDDLQKATGRGTFVRYLGSIKWGGQSRAPLSIRFEVTPTRVSIRQVIRGQGSVTCGYTPGSYLTRGHPNLGDSISLSSPVDGTSRLPALNQAITPALSPAPLEPIIFTHKTSPSSKILKRTHHTYGLMKGTPVSVSVWWVIGS